MEATVTHDDAGAAGRLTGVQQRRFDRVQAATPGSGHPVATGTARAGAPA
ncbi:hypothetical protein AB0O75_04410 [Streptomyces sp. NPDC088921]